MTEGEHPGLSMRKQILIFASLGVTVILVGLSHALVAGVLMKPYPWDDVDSVFHGYLNAYNILHASNFREFISGAFSGQYHAIGSVFATLGFLVGDQPVVAYLFVVLLTLVPLLGAMIVLRVPWWIMAPLFLASPFFLAAATTFKTDLLGGFAFGALAIILLAFVERPRIARLELWVVTIIGVIALTSKMTSIVNPIYYLGIAVAAVLLRSTFLTAKPLRFRHVLLGAIGQVELIAYSLAIPFIVYGAFFAAQYQDLTAYIYSVLGPHSMWTDTIPFLDRLKTVYFNNWGTVSFLPAIGSQYAAGTVSVGVLFAALSLSRPLVHWRTIALFIVGAAYVLALAWASPVTNPWFAAPGYGLIHFAALDFLLQSRRTSFPRIVVPVLAVLIGGYFLLTTRDGWQSNPFDGNGREYQQLLDAVSEAVKGVENPIIVQTAAGSPIPEPNISYELLRRNVVGRWIWTARVDKVEELSSYLKNATALIVVRVTDQKVCDNIPSCQQSVEIANDIEATGSYLRIASFDFPHATLTVYRTHQ